MKAPRRVVLAMLAALALGLALVGCGTQGGQEEQPTPTIDNAPNAGLSNAELVSVAATNMKVLKSYWVEFEGLQPSAPVSPTTRMTMSGYELVGKGIKLDLRGERSVDRDTAVKSWTVLNAIVPLSHKFGPEIVDLPGHYNVVVLGNEIYLSFDGGKTWRQPQGSQDMSTMVLAFVCSWNPDAWESDTASPACGNWVGPSSLSFTGAEPRTEVIDGVPTRHLALDLLAAEKSLPEGAHLSSGPNLYMSTPETMTAEVWVSTDATPRIVRMRYDIAVPLARPSQGEPTPATGVTYSLDWKWTRFNEDFGAIEPPPTETVR